MHESIWVKTLTSSSNLNVHIPIHISERLYVCGKCDRRFPTASNLLRHERIHTGQRPYPCLKCDKRFVTSSHLKNHEKWHAKGRPYPTQHACETWGKSFQYASHLRDHTFIHTGKQPNTSEARGWYLKRGRVYVCMRMQWKSSMLVWGKSMGVCLSVRL